jgi:predicted hydrocarbon binding protein
MSTILFDMFKFAKLLDIKDGQLNLMSTPVSIVPNDILCEQQKMLIDSLGMEKAYDSIYGAARKGSLKYNSEFIKKQHMSDKRKILDWQTKIVSFAGWGEIEIAMVDFKASRFVAHFKNSPYPLSYGKVKYAADFIATGFVAGGLSAMTKTNLDAVETKCRSRGDPFCELEVNTPETIKRMRYTLWKKWGVI